MTTIMPPDFALNTQESRAQKPADAAMSDLLVPFLRVVQGLAPAESLAPLLRAFNGSQGAKVEHFQRPRDVLDRAMESRNIALLNVVLDAPGFCPSESPRDRLALDPARVEQELRRRATWHGHDPFNGGMDAAGVLPNGQGSFLQVLRTHVAARLDRTHPQHPLALNQLPPEVITQASSWERMLARALGGQGYPRTFRRAVNTNLVGVAVLMGWDEGLCTLLDHGVNPYARVGGSSSFCSPLVLAAVHGEADALVRLIAHRTFKPMARYGMTLQQVERETMRAGRPVNASSTPWEDRPEHGGLDLVFLLERPELLNEPRVAQALMRRLTPSVVRRLMAEGDDAMPQTMRQTLEAFVLERTLLTNRPDAPVASTTPRPRSRL